MRDKIDYKGIVITDKEEIDWIEREVNEDLSSLTEDELNKLKSQFKTDNLLDLILGTSYKEVESIFGDSTITFSVWMAMYSAHSNIIGAIIEEFQQIARKSHTNIRVISDEKKPPKTFRVVVDINLNGNMCLKHFMNNNIEEIECTNYKDLKDNYLELINKYNENKRAQKNERKHKRHI